MTQTARVYVNNIEIGAIPVDQYEQMLKEVKGDRSLLLRQVGNIVWLTCRLVVWAFMIVPFLWVGLLLVMLLFAPGELATMLQVLTTTPIEEVVAGMRPIVAYFAIVPTMALSMAMALSGDARAKRFGYVNHRKRVLDYRLKRLLESPANGPLEVIVWTENWPQVLASAE